MKRITGSPATGETTKHTGHEHTRGVSTSVSCVQLLYRARVRSSVLRRCACCACVCVCVADLEHISLTL